MTPLDALEDLAALLLATSLAGERLVVIVKTLIPWLAVEKTDADLEVDLSADRPRRLAVQSLAVAASYATVALLFGTADPTARVTIGEGSYYLGLVAVLGSGGSALWGGVVAYVKELKDVTIAKKASARMELRAAAAMPRSGIAVGGTAVGVGQHA